ncbi:MAG: hypothetical protein HY744_29950 [Deltaproteobacteria bacterium]|nr:hypothetical protein [Deltaproteobacteria bacterium]
MAKKSARDQFVAKAYSSVGNMYDAMKVLDCGCPRGVRNLAAKWGIKLSEEDACEMVESFTANLRSKPDDPSVKVC